MFRFNGHDQVSAPAKAGQKVSIRVQSENEPELNFLSGRYIEPFNRVFNRLKNEAVIESVDISDSDSKLQSFVPKLRPSVKQELEAKPFVNLSQVVQNSKALASNAQGTKRAMRTSEEQIPSFENVHSALDDLDAAWALLESKYIHENTPDPSRSGPMLASKITNCTVSSPYLSLLSRIFHKIGCCVKHMCSSHVYFLRPTSKIVVRAYNIWVEQVRKQRRLCHCKKIFKTLVHWRLTRSCLKSWQDFFELRKGMRQSLSQIMSKRQVRDRIFVLTIFRQKVNLKKAVLQEVTCAASRREKKNTKSALSTWKYNVNLTVSRSRIITKIIAHSQNRLKVRVFLLWASWVTHKSQVSWMAAQKTAQISIALVIQAWKSWSIFLTLRTYSRQIFSAWNAWARANFTLKRAHALRQSSIGTAWKGFLLYAALKKDKNYAVLWVKKTTKKKTIQMVWKLWFDFSARRKVKVKRSRT